MILVIDQNKKETNELMHQIQDVYQGDEVVTVSNANDAMEYVKNNNVDICFMEPILQHASSTQFINVLRRFSNNVKVNFIADNEEYALMGWNLHINDYLMRPLTCESIMHSKLRAEGL